MPNFRKFAASLSKHFTSMAGGELYRSSVTPDQIWSTYLASFPEGTNPMFRVRTEYDSVYDRAVLRKIGNAVAIKNGKLITLWDDHEGYEYPYNVVCKALFDLVSSATVSDLFRSKELKLGYVQTTETREGMPPIIWEHFHAEVPQKFYARDSGPELSEARSSVAVLERSIQELSLDAVDTVLDLIAENGLYRGAEHKSALTEFRRLHVAYHVLTSAVSRSIFLWENHKSFVSRFRNTVIGTLVSDLSLGVEIDKAVASFEAKVAPSNYQRPTAVVTKGMIEQAKKTILDLGLSASLQRRHARLSDVNVNDVLWVDRGAAKQMLGALDILTAKAEAMSKPSNVATKIDVGEFLQEVVPSATGIEIQFTGAVERNLVNVTVGEFSDAPPLFKWDSSFAWAYKGGAADSIKDKVKKAGGNINADIRVSLAWSNYDDLDLHCECPYGHIYYGNKGYISGSGPILDVDENAGHGRTRTPVENLAFNRPLAGVYKVYVNQFSPREDRDLGFTLEVEYGGKVHRVSHTKRMRLRENVEVVEFRVSGGKVTEIKFVGKALISEPASDEVWGIKGNTFVPVTTVMLSPNYWSGRGVGNKHWFFMLKGAKNPDDIRGMYNEFLRSDLIKHRKVFELLGSEMKVPYSEDQLCGVGFSSTMGDTATFKVTTAKGSRVYEVTFKESAK